jgi:predicted nucleic acid-binding protein
MPYLIDTNVISELRKGVRCDPVVQSWHRSELEAQGGFLSVVSIGEIRKGVELIRKRDLGQAAVLESWLGTLCQQYSTRILPITMAIAEEWGRLNSTRPLPAIDSLLAATASVNGLVLATRNVEDLRGIGMSLVNPFAYGSNAYTI